MGLRYFLTEYTDETYPAERPTLQAWAAWLANPDLDKGWGRDQPATPGEEFEGYVTALVARFTFIVGDAIPTSAAAWDWCCIDDSWEESGNTIAEAIAERDEGEEVSVTCFKDVYRRYRFDVAIDGPSLTDTDPATAPTSSEAVRDVEQPVLL